MRILVSLIGLMILSLPVDRAGAGPVQPETTGPESYAASSEQLHQLEKCREGIVDENARTKDRRRWVELLFSYHSDQARSLIVELLRLSHRPQVQQTLCEVLRDHARNRPAALPVDFLEPLMELLAAPGKELRRAAASALADFPGTGVPVRLRQIAVNDHEPGLKRLAAIDALAPNTHRREVVRQLIQLLDVGDQEITSRVMKSLEPASLETFGHNPERWRLWWIEKSQLSEEAWLDQQLNMYRDRWRRLADEFTIHHEQIRRERDAITTQTRHFQRELFRATRPEQRSDRLVEWLDHSLPVVQLTAMEMIKARIADEGERPDGQILSALLRLLDHPAPSMRREVLLIVQTLNDPAVVHVVLARLDQEQDPLTRHALFKAIGKLGHPVAVPVLIREIADAGARMECVAEAAIALGQIATRSGHRPDDTSAIALEQIASVSETPRKAANSRGLKPAAQDVVEPLKNRYQSICKENLCPPLDMEVRAALLSAMAGVADPSFAPELLGAVESNDANLLQPAIRGLLALCAKGKENLCVPLPMRFRTLMGHTDPLVRLAATEAVGELGREDADLETILTRLLPSAESNELVRQAAWRSLNSFMRHRPVTERIEASRRLRDTPELEARYLVELSESCSSANADPICLNQVLDRLSAVLTLWGKYARAIPYLRQLYQMRVVRKDSSAGDIGIRWLKAELRAAGPEDISDSIIQLRQSAKENFQTKIMHTIIEYMESPEMSVDSDRTRMLVHVLQSIPVGTWGEKWSKALARWRDRLPSDADEPPG